MSHHDGHGTATLPAEYVTSHVRLGYAATAHGHQADTVDVSIAVITEATSHRSLYVGATRGRDQNQLLVVTDDPDQVRDVLERVLTNDRADVPAVVQRRNLARQVPRTRDAADAVASARHALEQARHAAEPALRALHAADLELRAAEHQLRMRQRDLDEAPRWRRRGMASLAQDASDALETVRIKVEVVERAAAPHTAHIDAAEMGLRQAEHDASMARIRDRLELLPFHSRSPTDTRGIEVERAGLGLER